LAFKKVLVPYDGSKQSEKALRVAAEFVGALQHKDIRLILIYVVVRISAPFGLDRPMRSLQTGRIITTSKYMTELYEAIEADAKMMLEGKKKSLVSSSSGLIVETTVLHGKPADKIIDYAKNEKIDVIIIGGQRPRFKTLQTDEYARQRVTSRK
jgi:nucleotide-binding universal stress UspA family protein